MTRDCMTVIVFFWHTVSEPVSREQGDYCVTYWLRLLFTDPLGGSHCPWSRLDWTELDCVTVTVFSWGSHCSGSRFESVTVWLWLTFADLTKEAGAGAGAGLIVWLYYCDCLLLICSEVTTVKGVGLTVLLWLCLSLNYCEESTVQGTGSNVWLYECDCLSLAWLSDCKIVTFPWPIMREPLSREQARLYDCMTVTVFSWPIVREPLSREQPLTVITSPVSSVKGRSVQGRLLYTIDWFKASLSFHSCSKIMQYSFILK